MKSLRFDRHAPLLSWGAAFLLTAALVLRASAAPMPRAGHLGQALALSAALNTSKEFFQGVAAESGFDPRHAPNGRFIYSPSDLTLHPRVGGGLNGTSLVPVNEPVQTFDIFAPPPAFLPVVGPPATDGTLDTSATQQLTPTNLTPIWTADQSYIIFASNRSVTNPLAVGPHFHLWAAPSTGDSPPFPLTTGNADEAFPAINGNDIAFTSTAQPGSATPGTYHNLFTMQFNSASTAATAVDPSTLTSPLENLNDSGNAQNDNYGSTKTFGDSGNFTDVQRPTWAPSGDRIVFSANTTNTGDQYVNHYHLYFLYVGSNGYQASAVSGTPNPPALLTDGPANDTDPAWEPGGSGDYIAFASTATAIETNPLSNSGTQANPTPGAEGIGPDLFPTLTGSPNANGDRTIFVIDSSGSNFGLTPQGGGQVTTAANTDNFGPAWSLTTPNQYLNPEGGQSVYDYLTWARSGNPTATPPVLGGPNVPHGIYYLRLIANVGTATLNPEGSTTSDGETNNAVHLDTDDNGSLQSVTTGTGTTAVTTIQNAGANVYDDTYPTFSPLLSVFSIAYSSNRSVTYNYPATTTVYTSATGQPTVFPAGAPSETAISVPPGQSNVAAGSGTTYDINPTGNYPAYEDIPGAYTTGPTSYTGILQSQILNLDPPTLLNFSASEVIHAVQGQNVIDTSTQSAQRVFNPGGYVTFLVRLSNREAGIENSGANALPDVYLQIKDPNSKYQDAQFIEHKVFAKPDWYYEVTNEDTPANFYQSSHASGGTILHPRPDSGSSTLLTQGFFGNSSDTTEVLYNTLNLFNDNTGTALNYADGANTIPGDPVTSPVQYYPQVGAIGGPDRNSNVGNISVGRDGGGANTILPSDSTIATASKPALPSGAVDGPALAGGDWKNFIPWGPEYECQYVNPSITSTGRDPATVAGDYGTPFYLAGYDDQGAYNGYDPTGGDAGQADITPPSNIQPIQQIGIDAVHPPRPATGGDTSQWLQLKPVPGQDGLAPYQNLKNPAEQDNQGGVLYYATWKTPSASDASDFYLDVIAYDQARFPNLPTDTSAYAANQIFYPTNQGNFVNHANYKKDNWRIYDNVWGFTTQQNIAENKDILVVSDYALGQKFAFSTFGGQEGASNLPPKLFGTESYVTDVDEGVLPDSAFYNYTQGDAFATGTGTAPYLAWPIVQHLNNYGGSADFSGGSDFDGTVNTQILNGLGVGSYYDTIVGQQNDADPAGTGYPYVKSQQYALWRVQCRGQLPSSQLDNYAPQTTSQPAVADPSFPQYNSAQANVPNAHQCVIWLSPYTDDLLAPVGTLADPYEQNSLENYVSLGGRLFVTGQDVASGLTGGAAGATTTFLTQVLNVSLASGNGGTQTLTGAGDRVSGNGQNGGNNLNFYEYVDTPNTNYVQFLFDVFPSANPMLLSNNYSQDGRVPAKERLDASLDQLGGSTARNITDFGLSAFQPQIDQVTPIANANRTVTTDITDPGAGLIYYQDSTTNSRVVYASFGIEALSTEYYGWFSGTGLPNASPPNYEVGETQHFSPRNTRQNVLHNIVDYLRTGTITGRIVQNANGTSGVGQPVVGATVYLIPTNGTAPQSGAHPYYSGTTDSSGSYVITGVDPGNYSVGAYASGFHSGQSNTYVVVEGDTANQEQNVDIEPLASGSISGTVKDTNGNPISGATVTFTNTSTPNIVGTATTNANGAYSVNVPAGTSTTPDNYTGVATDPPSYGTETYPTPIPVTTGNTTTANFTLPIASSSITGTVTDTSGNPLSGVTVTATPVTSGTTSTTTVTGSVSATTGTNGTYTITPVAPGNYTLTATDPGYTQTGTPPTITVPAGQSLGAPTIVLQAAQAIQTVITVNGNGIGVSGATVTISQGGSTVATGTTDSNGQLTETLDQGSYTIMITAPSFNTLTATLTIPTTVTSPYDAPPYTLTAETPVATGLTANAFNLVSYPNTVEPASGSAFDEVFGPLRTTANPSGYRSYAYLYDSSIGGYLTDPPPGLVAGLGYFVYVYQPFTTYGLLGTPPAGKTVTVTLQGGNGLDGWNMIGVPSTSSINVSALQVTINGNAFSFSQAASLYNAVSPTLYGYNPTTGAYYSVSGTGTLQPFQGYWIHANQAHLTLLIPTNQATTAATAATRSKR